MPILNHIDRLSPSADVRSSLLSAANALLYGYVDSGKKALETMAYVPGLTMHADWRKLTRSRITGPSAKTLRNIDLPHFDKYTFTMEDGYEDNFLMGIYILLEDYATLYMFNPDLRENVIADILASSMHCMLLGDTKQAFAYLSFLQTYLRAVVEVRENKTEPEPTELLLDTFDF